MMRLFSFAIAAGIVAAQDAQNNQAKLPEGPGRAVVEKACTGCHGLENVVRARMTKERWGAVVDDMISRGATANDDQIDQIVDYLAANFGKPKQQQEDRKH